MDAVWIDLPIGANGGREDQWQSQFISRFLKRLGLVSYAGKTNSSEVIFEDAVDLQNIFYKETGELHPEMAMQM